LDLRREKNAVRFLVNKRVDGIICMPTDESGLSFVPALKAGIPVVLANRMIPSLSGNISAVASDHGDSAQKANWKLLESGHVSIALILGQAEAYTTRRYLEGYYSALGEYGCLARPGLIAYGGNTVQGGYTAIKKLLAHRPSAVLTANCEMTLGAILALGEEGIDIPGEMSLIGFESHALFDVMTPRLTLVRQPENAIGEYAAKLLLTHISEPQTPKKVIEIGAQLYDDASVKSMNV
jgi:LacI family transcriptional regulator